MGYIIKGAADHAVQRFINFPSAQVLDLTVLSNSANYSC